jgi:hypothetical protein
MQLALGRVPLEYPVNHKLRVLVRVDADPGHVSLEVTGCLTQSAFPALLQIIRRAGRLGAGADVVIDLHGSSHLDPEILLHLRSIANASTAAAEPGAELGAAARAGEPCRITLAEPADLPICLLHVGSDGEVRAGLEGDLAAVRALDAVNGPIPSELHTINGLELSEYFEGTLDPAATVRALSDVALGQLADALYRHLDTNSPSFGAHTWFELVTEELQNRQGAEAVEPGGGELAAGSALA